MRTHQLKNNYLERCRACEIPGLEDWNNRWLAALKAHGLKIAPTHEGVYRGEHGPIWAPLPSTDCPDPFHYPSVIVEADDERDYTLDPEPRYEARGPYEEEGPCAVAYVFRDGYHRRCTRFVVLLHPTPERNHRRDAHVIGQALALVDDVDFINRIRP